LVEKTNQEKGTNNPPKSKTRKKMPGTREKGNKQAGFVLPVDLDPPLGVVVVKKVKKRGGGWGKKGQNRKHLAPCPQNPPWGPPPFVFAPRTRNKLPPPLFNNKKKTPF